MWVSKKKWEGLEKKVADFEKIVRSQQDEIISLKHLCGALKKAFGEINHQELGRLESPEKLASQCVPSDSDSLAFRVNLNSRKLFEQSVEPKY